MDKAKGLLIKTRVDDELWASKNTTLYFDVALSQKAVKIAKGDKIGSVVEVNDNYLLIYYIEDEDNQQSLYLSPKSKTHILILDINIDETNERKPSRERKVNQSNGWFSDVLATIGQGINAYIEVKDSNYEDYVNSKTTYPNYTFPKRKTNDSTKSEENNTASQTNNNTTIYLVGFLFLLLVLVIIFKVSNRSKIDTQVQKNPPQRVIVFDQRF